MKIYAIIDGSNKDRKELAYFILFEKLNQCYIEIRNDVDEWELPFVLEHFVRNGKRIVDQYHTMLWLRQRIVPSDRQNIGAILKDNGLDEYDEIKLFLLADGRCSQDDCYIKKIKKEQLPDEIKNRMAHKIISIINYKDCDYMLTFEDETVGLLDLKKCTSDFKWIERLLPYIEKFKDADVLCGGGCVEWNEKWQITYDYLYENAIKMPFKEDVLKGYISKNVISTREVMEILNCTRQNVNDLVKRGRLKPIKKGEAQLLFYKRDVEALL